MQLKSRIAQILSLARSSAQRERELHEEIRSHIELEAQDNIERGMTPAEARRVAHVKFGNTQLAHDEAASAWRLPSVESVLADLKFGWRVLWKSPVFASVSVLTIALGIGCAAGIFTVAHAVLLKPQPYPESRQIVLLWGSDGRGANRGQVSFTDIEDIRRRNRVFSAIANFADWTPALSGAGEPERLAATQVSDGFFDVLGIKPSLGRAFTPEEHIDGKDNVVILSYELWRQKFQSDPSVIGRAIKLNTMPHVIVGVMPERFRPLPSTLVQGGQLYRPIGETYDDTQRRSEHLRAIARLRPGVSLEQAQNDVDRIAHELEREHPKEDSNVHFKIATLQRDAAHELRPSLMVLTGAVITLLLIACANVAGLMLARSNARRKEFAVRAALGAARSRMARQSLVESLMLATTGGACGITLAYAISRFAYRLAPKLGSTLADVSLDTTAVLFTAGAVVLATLLFGLAPAVQSAYANVSLALKQQSGSAGVSGSNRRFHSGVVVSELALALTLLTVAGVLVQSFVALQHVNIGFDPNGRLMMNVWLPSAKYKQPQAQINFYGDLIRRVSALPGVHSVAIVQNPPLGNYDGRAMLPEGWADEPGNYLSPQTYFISSAYLSTMGIPLLRGRAFNDADDVGHEKVAIVSKSLAERIFPGQDAVGKRLQLLSDMKVNGRYPYRRVVGVVADIRHLGPDEKQQPGLYIPYRQLPSTFSTLLIHAQNPLNIVPSVRDEVLHMDADIAVFGIATYEQMLADALVVRRVAMNAVVGFGVVAVFLAAVGIYGLLSYGVSLRMREFGVRAALGARQRDLILLILASASRLLIYGSVAGALLSYVALRLTASTTNAVAVSQGQLLLAAGLLVGLIATAASSLPARTAARVDPAETLRSE